MFGLGSIITVLKGINTGFETLGHFMRLRQSLISGKNGTQIIYELAQREQIPGNIINTGTIEGDLNTTNYFVPSYEFFLAMTSLMLRNPEQYNLQQIELIRSLSSSQISKYYQNISHVTPVIMPDGASNYVIGNMPTGIARHAFLRGINHNPDISVFRNLGFQIHHPDVLDSKHISALPFLDRVYFVQLYKDYIQLKNWVGSTQVKNFDEFILPLYQQKNRLETTEGWDHVLFELTTRRTRNIIRVGTVPVKMMGA